VRRMLSSDASWSTVRGPPGRSLTVTKRNTAHEQKEVGGLTVMIAHPSLEDVSSEEEMKLLLPDLYEAPVAEIEHIERETESYVAWVVVLGFVAYALALYWAERCRRKGGDPAIRFSLLRGFTVRCYR
jgi:hypothetical protein